MFFKCPAERKGRQPERTKIGNANQNAEQQDLWAVAVMGNAV
jgi:hypothetical protein